MESSALKVMQIIYNKGNWGRDTDNILPTVVLWLNRDLDLFPWSENLTTELFFAPPWFIAQAASSNSPGPELDLLVYLKQAKAEGGMSEVIHSNDSL